MTIIEALEDRHLFGALPAFRDLTSWGAWRVFLRAVYGLPLTDAADRALFCRHTGRTLYHPPKGGWREVVAVIGRQSGKTRVSALIAAYEAMMTPAGDSDVYAALVAQDARGALRSLFGYARSIFDRVPVLTRSVSEMRAETITVESGCVIAVYPCRPAALRGIRARVVICDELAHFRTSEGNPVDVEMLRAVRPTLATTDGRLIILSSPYAQTGALYDLHRRHFGVDGSPVLVWQASAPQMNPLLPSDYLARMRAEDPEAARSEIDGEFRTGVSTLLDPDALQACVAAGVRERAPEGGRAYVAFADPASGSGRDAFTCAIAHGEGERAVLDVVRAWRPPFNPGGVIAEMATLLRSYGLRDVTGDSYAPGFVAEACRAAGLTYHASEADRSALYLELVPAVNAGRVSLLDEPEMLRELRGIERRRGASGRDRADHRPGAHDDRANAAAGSLYLVGQAYAHPGAQMFDPMTGVWYDPTHSAPDFDFAMRVSQAMRRYS